MASHDSNTDAERSRQGPQECQLQRRSLYVLIDGSVCLRSEILLWSVSLWNEAVRILGTVPTYGQYKASNQNVTKGSKNVAKLVRSTKKKPEIKQ